MPKDIDLSQITDAIKRYPKDVQVKALRDLIADQYRESLYLTAKYLLGYKDITWRTHGGMIQALENDDIRKLLVLPRGAFKSSIGVVAFAIWSLLKDPNERILIDSEVYTNSKNFLREIKAHLTNPKVTALFGEFKTRTWNEGELIIAQRDKPYKEASITCGGIGTVKVGQHYSTIIGDDLNSGNNSATPEARAKVIKHYQMNTAILDPGGKYIVIGTRYAQDDIIGWILQNEVMEVA